VSSGAAAAAPEILSRGVVRAIAARWAAPQSSDGRPSHNNASPACAAFAAPGKPAREAGRAEEQWDRIEVLEPGCSQGAGSGLATRYRKAEEAIDETADVCEICTSTHAGPARLEPMNRGGSIG